MNERELSRDTTAVVLAGGEGRRLRPLTRHLCKPALPFGAGYRNIDFSLSNCVNSDIRHIGIATQHKPEALFAHIEQVWRGHARRKGEFIEAWPAETRAPVTGYRGTADAVFRNLDLIERQGRGFVLVLAGDHVYQMDYRPMLAFHRSRRADVTVGSIEVPAAEANQFGILSVDALDRIVRFIEKPKTLDELPRQDMVLASMGIYVFGAEFLARVLREDAVSSTSKHDFGRDILPSLLEGARVYAYPFLTDNGRNPGYWRDVGTPAAYWRAHLELLDETPSLRLDDALWPLPSIRATPALTARHARAGTARASSPSLIAAGCKIDGELLRSVLFESVCVSAGSRVERCVVLPGAVVGRNCRLSDAIVEAGCRVPDGAVIDSSWRGTAPAGSKQPVVVTAEDFMPELIYAYA